MTHVAPTVSAILRLRPPAAASGRSLKGIVYHLQPAVRVAILAPDALGYLAFMRWQGEMPFLKSLHEHRSLVLRAVMPTITPVNFATMVTGAEPAVHGIGAFTDSFQCETLFDLVREHGWKSAGVGQKGYTGSELLGRHAELWGKAESNTDAEVESIALGFAREFRPRFLIVQLGSTDDIFHAHGPSSPEVAPVLKETDARLQRMVDELKRLDYALIILSDHGQHDTATGGSHGTEADEDALVPCTWLK